MNTTPQNIVIGAIDRTEIEQNIRLIIATMSFDVRMDCRFAGKGAYIDAPLPHQAAKLIAELTEAIEENEPRVKVLELSFARDSTAESISASKAAMDGKIYPILKYTIKEVTR